MNYINESGRNDIVTASVARDKDNIYFYVQTAETLSSRSDPAWMRLFIDIDMDKNTGWEGYDFVINRRSPNEKAFLEKSDFGWNWQQTGQIDYAVKGNEMEIKVPRTILGTTDMLNFGFKYSDNMQHDNDIMDFWVNGDAAPAGRANFHYNTAH